MDFNDLDIDDELFSFFDVTNDDLFYDVGDLPLAENGFVSNVSTSDFLNTNGYSQADKSAKSGDKTGSTNDPNALRNVNNPKILIPQHDVRRSYAKIFADAFNSCDVKITLKWLEDYCSKDCLLVQRCIGKENPFIPKYIEVLGIPSILEFWRTLFMTVPDALMVMLETKLRVKNITPQVVTLRDKETPRSGERRSNTVEVSCIVSSFSFTGTKLYQLTAQNATLSPQPGSSGSQDLVTTADNSSSSNNNSNNNSNSSNSGSNGGNSNGILALNNSMLNNNSSSNKNYNGLEKAVYPIQSSEPIVQYTETITAATAAAANQQQSSTIVTNTGRKTKKRPLETSATDLLNQLSAKYNPPSSSAVSNAMLQAQQHGHHKQSSNPYRPKEKSSNYMFINANTKLSAGDLILPANSHLDFLGTLNMLLDSHLKIVKIEFIYSPTD